MQVMYRALVCASLFCALVAPIAQAQERFSIFVGSDPTNVERMLKLAQLRDDDTVIDLGSGDGRIVIGAALMNSRLRGIGVDIDQKLVRQATDSAHEQQVADRVRFIHANAFDADLSKVSVIFMWLWPEIQTMLRPKILREARPGTRVVTNVWDLGSWQPDQVNTDGPAVSMWYVPARVEGYWSWDVSVRGANHNYATVMEQRFQRAEGFTRVGNRRGIFREVRLRGEDITILLDMTLDGAGFARHEFQGKVRGDTIEGTVRIAIPTKEDRHRDEVITLPWVAKRTPETRFFAPTGLQAP